MRIITEARLADYWAEYPDARTWLVNWRAVVRRSHWRSIADVRGAFPHADPVRVGSGKSVSVFNACGNKYRLVTALHYNTQIVYVLRFMTHAEYGNGRWKVTL
jgi:mRNA interferase HigB